MRVPAIIFLASLLGLTDPGRAAPASVSLAQEARSFTLSNDLLTVRVSRRDGRIESMKRKGTELLEDGGYWSVEAGGENGNFGGFGVAKASRVTIDPATNGGQRGEVAVSFEGGAPGTFPGKQEVRYELARGASVVHAWAALRHGPGDAGFSVGEGRFVLKLRPSVFDYFTVDAQRRRLMPTGADWDRGEQLNLKEVRRLTTGLHKGLVEHKYGYSAMLGAAPAYGWCGTKEKIGLWMVNPSLEYLAGGPTKVELTGHLDVNPGGTPVLLNMWHGSHYGGSSLVGARDEEWARVIGPFGIYVNQGGEPDSLWKDALAAAAQESKQWPFAWVSHSDYPPEAGRGSLTGKLVLHDPVLPSLPASAWVGLTAADYPSGRSRFREMVGWQRDGKNYQYWARTGPDGTFAIPHVRPGVYALRAFADGVLGEFARAEVKVAAGAATALGEVEWRPLRYGSMVWEIGIPNRSGSEFRNGDRYWLWGNYLRYAAEFPDDVDFTIGKSDFGKDWNYCQPPRLDDKFRVLAETEWKVRFTRPQAPTGEMVLRLSLCGFREGGALDVAVNGQPAGTTGRFPENGVMHRDGVRGYWREFPIRFPAGLLRDGENVLTLHSRASTWHQGVVYDFLRLERVEPAVPAK